MPPSNGLVANNFKMEVLRYHLTCVIIYHAALYNEITVHISCYLSLSTLTNAGYTL